MEGGFIQGKLEIKLLLLYILCRTEAPVPLDTLADVALCDPGVTYFDLSSALAELTESDHVTLSDQLYQITDKGRKNGTITEDHLPYSVRLRCDHRLAEINRQLRYDRRVHAEVIRKADDRFQVSLVLDGEREPEFTLTLLRDTKEEAERLEAHFRRNPEEFIRKLDTL